MKRYIKSTSYKSGDRYYGRLPQEPSSEEYGKAMEAARNNFDKFLSDNNVTVRDTRYGGSVAKYQSYTWTTPSNQHIEIVYYNRWLGGSMICELYVDGRGVDVYKSEYNGWRLTKVSLMDVISAFNTNDDKLSLVFYK